MVTRRIPGAGIDLLATHFEVDANRDDHPYTPDELAERARGADALVALLTDRIDEALLARCPRLKVVANVAVGYDNVDLAAAQRHGVLVTNTPGVLTDATADFAFTLLMASARRVAEADRFVRAGRFAGWMMMEFLGGDLAGRTLGIAGFGRIGQAVARRGRAFGLKVLYQDEHPAPPALDVYEREPDVHPDLLGLDNVTLAPHIASATVETRTKMALIAAENAIAAVQGHAPPNLVTE